jgi:hypothetical protein
MSCIHLEIVVTAEVPADGENIDPPFNPATFKAHLNHKVAYPATWDLLGAEIDWWAEVPLKNEKAMQHRWDFYTTV